MLVLHHLENSRSQRILWLMEELGLDYEIVHYARDPVTSRAPAALRDVHPLGKSPVLADGDTLLCESGAIVEYLVSRHGDGRLVPASGSPEWARYIQWLHFAEGSAMFPLLLDLFLGMLPEGGAPLGDAVKQEARALLGYLETELEGRDYFAGDEFSAADVLMSFVVDMAQGRGFLEGHERLVAHQERMRARPAYQRAQERGAS